MILSLVGAITYCTCDCHLCIAYSVSQCVRNALEMLLKASTCMSPSSNVQKLPKHLPSFELPTYCLSSSKSRKEAEWCGYLTKYSIPDFQTHYQWQTSPAVQ